MFPGKNDKICPWRGCGVQETEGDVGDKTTSGIRPRFLAWAPGREDLLLAKKREK